MRTKLCGGAVMEQQQNTQSRQMLTLENRSQLSLSGVLDVENYAKDALTVILTDAQLYIEGEGLRILSLCTEKNTLLIDGMVTALVYSDAAGAPARGKRSLFSRLFGA